MMTLFCKRMIFSSDNCDINLSKPKHKQASLHHLQNEYPNFGVIWTCISFFDVGVAGTC